MSTIRKYPVLVPIQHGDRYEPGDTIDLTDHDAAQLLSVGAIGPIIDIVEEDAPKRMSIEMTLDKLAHLDSQEELPALEFEETRPEILEAIAAAKLVLPWQNPPEGQ